VRLALGASTRGIVLMILSRALILIAGGTLFGGLGAMAGRALLTRTFFDVDAANMLPWLIAATLVVMVTAIAAALPPAMRAAAIDPTIALRAE